MLTKAILFDLDDTIVSYHSLSNVAWNQVCAKFVVKNESFKYSELHQEMIHLFPGAFETLQKLVRRGVKLALLTNGNSRKQRYKISKFDLEKYFETCLVEEELSFGKPDIRFFQMACDRHPSLTESTFSSIP